MFILDNRNKRGFTPVIQINIDGREVSGPFYSRLIKATIRDEAGQSSDMATIELDDARNELQAPREKAQIEIKLGFRETGLRPRGVYELQNIEFSGGDDGETMVLQAKAADLRRSLKDTDLETFENTTYGDIARKLAKRSNLDTVIDPALDKIPIGFEVKNLGQSDIDFLTRLSDEHDAILKPAGGKMVATRRGSGKSASGLELPPLIIRKSDCVEWKINPNGRVEYSKVRGSHIDQTSGKRIDVDYDTGLSGPTLTLPDISTSKARTKSAVEAEGRRLNRNTGNGYFKLYGRPEAMAEMTAQAQGFRAEINGDWRVNSVEDEFSEKGYVTIVNIKAPESGRKEKAEMQQEEKTSQPQENSVDDEPWPFMNKKWEGS